MGLLRGLWKGVTDIFSNPMQLVTIGLAIASGNPWLIAAAISTAAYGNYQTKRMEEKAKAAYNNSLQDRLTNALTAEEPFQVIYGTAKVGGAITAVLKSGTKDEYRHIVIVHAAHEVEEIGTIYINGTSLGTLDSNGDVQTGNKYYKDSTSYVRVKKHLGGSTDAADASLISECPSYWSSAHLLRGFAYTVIRINLNFDEFQSGLPQVHAVIKGKKLYDPRTSTTVWSDNPALCIYDYLTSSYGANQPTSSLVLSTFNTAANACDETISIGKRYTCNGSFKTDQDPKQVLDTLADSMAGFISQSGGWMIHAGVYTEPVLDLTESDLVGGVQISPAPALNDVFNTVKGQFSNPDKDYIVTDYQPYQNASYLSADGKELSIDYTLLFTNSNQRCQNIVRVVTERAREALTVKAKFTLKAWPLQCGDRVTLTNSAYGWSSKVFRVIEWNFNLNEPVELVLQEDGAAIYDEADAVSTDAYPNTGLPDSYTIGAPTGLSAVMGNNILADGTLQSYIRASWTAPTSGIVRQYELQWIATDASPINDTTYQSTFCTTLNYNIQPIITGKSYYLRVRAITFNNVRSDWNTLTFAATGDTTAPSAPTSLTATAAYKTIQLSWSNPTDKDYAYTEIWENSTNNSATATKIGSLSGSTYARSGIAAATTKYYWVKAVDFSGNISAFSTGASATTDSAAINGNQAATAYLYQWSTTTPSDPSGTSTYTWATASNGSYTGAGGWSTTVPANPGTSGIQLWQAKKGVTDVAGATTTSVSWTSGFSKESITQNGTSAVQSATASVYQWAITRPIPPSGTSTYTWADGTFAAPTSWFLSSQDAPSAGYTLWEAQVSLTDTASATTTTINWTNAVIIATGYAGDTTSRNRMCYTKTSLSSLDTAPYTVTTSGEFSYPFPNTWGNGTYVKVASTANITTLSGLLTIDGVTVAAGDRVLVKNQTTSANNGIYVAASGAWSRATDADTFAEYYQLFVYVEQGTTNKYTGWTSTSASSGTLGSTTIPFIQNKFANVELASTANISSLTGTTFEGVQVAYGTRVLLKNQTTQSQNGIYVINDTWTRATDADVWSEVVGLCVFVQYGTNSSSNKHTTWVSNAASTGTIGTTSFSFTQPASTVTQWVETPPAITAGEVVYQSEGIYNETSGLTVWNVPYIASLKVGALSALSANLGTVTAGDLHANRFWIGNGKGFESCIFKDNKSGYDIPSTAQTTWDGSGVTLTQTVSTDVFTDDKLYIAGCDFHSNPAIGFNQRVRNTDNNVLIPVIVTLAALQDHYLSLWYRYVYTNGTFGSWIAAGNTVADTTGGDGYATLVFGGNFGIGSDVAIQFGFTPTDHSYVAYDNGKRYVKNFMINVIAVNI